jgi:hypothetical protein
MKLFAPIAIGLHAHRSPDARAQNWPCPKTLKNGGPATAGPGQHSTGNEEHIKQYFARKLFSLVARRSNCIQRSI